MLIRNPSEFEHVARDWAVKYAGAPKKEIAEGSGGATAESIKRKAQQAKDNEAKVKLAAYGDPVLLDMANTNSITDTKDTTKILSTASLPWASTWKPSSPHSNTSVSTRWVGKTMSWRRRIWAISLPVCSAKHDRCSAYIRPAKHTAFISQLLYSHRSPWSLGRSSDTIHGWVYRRFSCQACHIFGGVGQCANGAFHLLQFCC